MTPSPSSDSSAAPAAAAAEAFCGLDVSKDKLDLAVDAADDDDAPKAVVETFANDPPGLARLADRLRALAPTLVVLEATGGYERAALNALLDAGLPVARVEPRRVRRFAQAAGLLAKSDALDARLLARYARLLRPAVAERRTASEEELAALLTCRRQLIDARTAHANQLETAPASPFVRRTLADLLKKLQKQVDKLDAQIAKLIDADDDLSGRRDLLEGVPAGWARRPPPRWPPSSRSSAGSTDARPAPWPAWPRTTTTPAATGAGGRSPAGGPRCGRCSTWPP